jgi:putative beta barrel porin BBP7
MRSVWFAVAIVAFCISAPGFALNDPPGLLPPAAPDEEVPLRGGKTVSRPLTPVEIPPEGPGEPSPPAAIERIESVCEQRLERRGPLGPSWDGMELLLWWPKAQPLPPLVTASRSGAPPVLDNPGTTLLIGGRAIANQDIAGGRFTLGWAVNNAQTLGFELVYFFLGSRKLDETVRAVNNPSVRSLGIPFVNAATGREDVFLLAAPGVSTGSVFVSTTTRVQGAEANIVANLLDGRAFRLNGLVGYRFLQVHEGLTVEQMRVRFGTPGTFGPIYDQFDAHNRFHAGQLGLHADFTGEWVFCELTGKVALGRTFEVVKIDGATSVYAPVIGGVAPVQYSPGGVLALPSNIGRTTENAFAVVPEATFKIGIKLGDSGRFYVGYNFIYLSDAVRPGDQVDRTVNPAQIPALNPGGLVADRPRSHFNRSDFWAQGLMIGLETRY